MERNVVLKELVASGGLDLAVTFDPEPGRPIPEEIQLGVHWLAAPGFRWQVGTPLPLVLFEPPCTFRRLALEALEWASIPWRMAFTSPSLSGLWAAAAAGLGVTVRTELGTPARVRRLRDCRLPPLPALAFRVEGGEGPGQLAISGRCWWTSSGPQQRGTLVERVLRPRADRPQPSAAR